MCVIANVEDLYGSGGIQEGRDFSFDGSFIVDKKQLTSYYK